MEKIHVSKNPTLEVISETEPHSYNVQRTNFNTRNPTHVQMPDSRIYKKPTIRLPAQTHDGHINQGYASNSQSSINRDGSTPSGVYREQYWVCSEPLRCRNWTRRERILFFVLLGLSTIVLGLVAVISFISRNSKNKTESPPSWFPWL